MFYLKWPLELYNRKFLDINSIINELIKINNKLDIVIIPESATNILDR